VTYKGTKTQDSATQKKFHCLLKAPSGSDEYFDAVDQALQWKAKAAARLPRTDEGSAQYLRRSD